MLLQTSMIDVARLRREAASWHWQYDAEVKALTLHGDDVVTCMIEIELVDGCRFISVREDDFGIGSEHIVFYCVHNS